jgi:hypothetical protein
MNVLVLAGIAVLFIVYRLATPWIPYWLDITVGAIGIAALLSFAVSKVSKEETKRPDPTDKTGPD